MTRNFLLSALIVFLFFLTGQAIAAMDDETLYRFAMGSIAAAIVCCIPLLLACWFAPQLEGKP